MDATAFVVSAFHQGRKLKQQHFTTEEQAREHAAYMSRVSDCVVLTTSIAAASPVRGVPPASAVVAAAD